MQAAFSGSSGASRGLILNDVCQERNPVASPPLSNANDGIAETSRCLCCGQRHSSQDQMTMQPEQRHRITCRLPSPLSDSRRIRKVVEGACNDNKDSMILPHSFHISKECVRHIARCPEPASCAPESTTACRCVKCPQTTILYKRHAYLLDLGA